MERVQGRIPKPAFYAIIAILFCLAIVSAISRTIVRWRKTKRIKLDDGFLIFACLCLVTTAGLLFQMIPLMYYLQNLQLNPSAGFVGATPPNMSLSSGDGGPNMSSPPPVELSSSFKAQIDRFRRWQNALTILSWTAIFCVKFSFLGFFRQLVDRLRPMELYWRGLVVFTGIAYVYCVSEPFFSCRESQATACGHGSARTLMLRLQGLSIFLDILTDALLISIPIRLLWRVRIKLRQKLGLGAFLSLSICMAVVSAIRVGGERYGGNYDFSWLFFWLELEACIAVSVMSLTAFPAVFVSRASSRPSGGPDRPVQAWYSSSMGRPRNREKIRSTDDIIDKSHTSKWPTYPPMVASGTGRGGGGGRTGRTDTTEEKMPPGQDAQPQGQQDMPLEQMARGGLQY